jgi:hypothetical protein
MINNEKLKSLREKFPEGTRVVLDGMEDPYSKLKPGDMGTVSFVDDIGSIHIKWDNGSTLGLLHIDKYHKAGDKD